jgi:hypothetical protein
MEQFSSHPLYKKHNIDSAMSALWEFYKKKFLPLFAISFVMSLIMQYASTFLDIKELQTVTDPIVMLETLKGYLVPIVLISLVNLLFTTILQYYILYNPLDKENNIIVSVARSLKYFIPYLIIMILLAFVGSIAMVLGLFVLIIGVFFSLLYVMMIYLFILPVMMVEGTNIADTINRTIKLAHRSFWANIGWVAIFIILLIVISLFLSGIILIPFTGNFIKTITNPEDATKLTDVTNNPVFIILSALVGALTLPLLPIFASILYFNSKAGEEQNRNLSAVNADTGKIRVEDLYAKPYSDDHPENPENKS